MAGKRKPWDIRPSKTSAASIADALKTEVESKASDLIANVLKPKHVRPPQEDEQFNYIADIGTKWHRNYFYFVSIYAWSDPNALLPHKPPISSPASAVPARPIP